MTPTCVLAADGGRARFFVVARPIVDGEEAGPELLEKRDLVNPEAEAMGKEIFTNMKSGRNRAAPGGPAHGYDDHRVQWTEELERRFAKRVAAELAEMVRDHGSERVVILSEPRLLGLLRQARAHELSNGNVVEITENVSYRPAHEILDTLVRHKIVPPRRASSNVYRPRGQPPPR